jgi:hypothetical protein
MHNTIINRKDNHSTLTIAHLAQLLLLICTAVAFKYSISDRSLMCCIDLLLPLTFREPH